MPIKTFQFFFIEIDFILRESFWKLFDKMCLRLQDVDFKTESVSVALPQHTPYCCGLLHILYLPHNLSRFLLESFAIIFLSDCPQFFVFGVLEEHECYQHMNLLVTSNKSLITILSLWLTCFSSISFTNFPSAVYWVIEKSIRAKGNKANICVRDEK